MKNITLHAVGASGRRGACRYATAAVAAQTPKSTIVASINVGDTISPRQPSSGCSIVLAAERNAMPNRRALTQPVVGDGARLLLMRRRHFDNIRPTHLACPPATMIFEFFTAPGAAVTYRQLPALIAAYRLTSAGGQASGDAHRGFGYQQDALFRRNNSCRCRWRHTEMCLVSGDFHQY